MANRASALTGRGRPPPAGLSPVLVIPSLSLITGREVAEWLKHVLLEFIRIITRDRVVNC